MTTIKSKIKSIIPQSIVNDYYHRPQAVATALLHNNIDKNMTIIGVTGTDGKTTTVYGLFHLLQEAGKNAGYISTVNANVAGQQVSTGLHTTTPSAYKIRSLLKQASQAHTSHMVLETTSHGLVQHRLYGIPFEIGIITNISHEHLDYHKTYANYLEAKARLLTDVKVAILNKQDISYNSLIAWLKKNNPKARVITFAISDKSADIYAGPIRYQNGYAKFTAHIKQQTFPGAQSAMRIELPLLGDHNVANALTVIATGLALRLEPKLIRQAINTYPTVPGRMEYHAIKRRHTFIDFAHTPNGMQHVLNFLRQSYLPKNKKLITVFGCTGERDKDKRPHMGEIACTESSVTILTSDDTRSENIESILDDIEPGCRLTAAQSATPEQFTSHHQPKLPVYLRIPDRATAIQFAATISQPGDVIALLGKGHETTILHGTTEYPWSELDAITTAFDRMK